MRVAHCVVFLVAMTSMALADFPHQEELAERVSQLENHLLEFLGQASNKCSGQSQVPSEASSASLAQLADLLRRVEALENAGGLEQVEEPEQSSVVCERGMGNGTQEYPPYLELSDSTLQRDILCDTHTDGGGWIVIQRRATGDVDFYRNWAAYREGFGNITGDFWLGNEALHTLTSQNDYELRIDVRVDGQELYATSSIFKVEDEADKYRLRLGSCSGNAGTGLCFHNDLVFSTQDRDNDPWAGNCAVEFHSGWWFSSCHRVNLNGRWGQPTAAGISWYNGGKWVFPNFTEMKIRRLPATTTDL